MAFGPIGDVDGVVREERERIASLLPAAEIHHVGATAIPGSITKGDIDIAVLVDDAGFEAAVTALGREYAVAQPHNWTPTFASFERLQPGRPPVGVQLSVGGSVDDFLVALRDRFSGDAELLAAYNALKREYEGSTADEYRAAKARFVAPLVAELRRLSPR